MDQCASIHNTYANTYKHIHTRAHTPQNKQSIFGKFKRKPLNIVHKPAKCLISFFVDPQPTFFQKMSLQDCQDMEFGGTETLVLVPAQPHISQMTLGKSFIHGTFIEGFILEKYKDERHSFCPQGAHRKLNRKWYINKQLYPSVINAKIEVP